MAFTLPHPQFAAGTLASAPLSGMPISPQPVQTNPVVSQTPYQAPVVPAQPGQVSIGGPAPAQQMSPIARLIGAMSRMQHGQPAIDPNNRANFMARHPQFAARFVNRWPGVR